MKKRILYDAGFGVVGLSVLVGMGFFVLIPLIIVIIVLVIKTVKKIKQYRQEEQDLAEKVDEK